MKKFLLAALAVVLGMVACKKDDPPTCRIMDWENATFAYGDTIVVRYSLADGSNGPIFKLHLELDNNPLANIAQPFLYVDSFLLATNDLSLGQHIISIHASDYGGRSSSDQKEFFLNGNVPVVKTDFFPEIYSDSVITRGIKITDGGEDTKWGFCYNSTGNPTINDNRSYTTEESDTAYLCTIKGLTKLSQYYIRAFAENSKGVAYGTQITVKTPDQTGIFTDIRDNKTYEWVKIGNQVWMRENLAWEGDGVSVKLSPDRANYWYGDSTYCSYAFGNKDKYYEFGMYYQFDAARNACPAGWHLPTTQEWEELSNYLGGSDIAGKYIKSRTGWQDNGNGNNESGFTGLPAGFIYNDGTMGFSESSLGHYGIWWVDEFITYASQYSTKFDSDKLTYSKDVLLKSHGRNVRCIKD